jgi:hypothetical protein
MTMKKLVYLTISVLFAIILGACATATPKTPATPVASATPTASEQMINPGDKVGDFLITTGGSKGITYVSTIHCPYDESAGIESCKIKVGTKVNVAVGIYDDSPSSGKTLDEYWSEHTYEMVIEGRPVNLQAFGSIEIYHPVVGTIRLWNVVIVTDKPGKITAQSTGVVDDEHINETAILTFIAP